MRRNPPRPLASLMRKSEKIDKALAMLLLLLQLGYFSCLTPRLGLEWREMCYTVVVHCCVGYPAALQSRSVLGKHKTRVLVSDGSGPTRYVGTQYRGRPEPNHIPPLQKEKVGLAHLRDEKFVMIFFWGGLFFCFVFQSMEMLSKFLVSEEIFICQLKQTAVDDLVTRFFRG